MELRLLASRGAFEKVRELPVVIQHTRNRATLRRLESVYYDTAKQLLFRHGISLRVRRNGRHFVQTLKLPPADGRPLGRRQRDVPVDSIVPDLARLPADEIGHPIMAQIKNTLVPVFTTKVRRYVQRLDFPDASADIVFDEGTIEAGTQQEAVFEIKLKLKSGNAGVLLDLGGQLLGAAPLQFSVCNTAERGYMLAFDLERSATKARLPDIAADEVVDNVIARLMGSCWHHLVKNSEVAQEETDPEGVHQMRVALRRLRTVCTMFQHYIPSPVFQAVSTEAKWVMQQLGRTRDWDVFAETATRLATTIPEIDLSGLREVVERQRQSNYGAVQAALADPRCSRFLLTLGHMIERRGWRNEIDSEALVVLSRPMLGLADKILARLHRKALKRGVHFNRLDSAMQHRLRIDVKKLRYAAEFLLPLYAAHLPVKRYVKRLAGLQAALGGACDIASSRTLIDVIRRNDQPALALAAGVVTGWQARDQLVAAKALRKRWRRFKTAETFWNR
ncbi:CHAD protein [Nitrobacter hamburgensis X14]|uniref:CHAD protein n=1 Tax=Nitrobacter hamburgensis (strain DSM 10229 / NCIMB 13809 / X14) TaxID=323097 RepID=Q1QPH0_NITHX|nr:CYTH and CHAD domain-containing protein [Nitrobacter hamburgensis]ABE61877.1 CHAD protein [Nitrobacter hamburgensis X14]